MKSLTEHESGIQNGLLLLERRLNSYVKALSDDGRAKEAAIAQQYFGKVHTLHGQMLADLHDYLPENAQAAIGDR